MSFLWWVKKDDKNVILVECRWHFYNKDKKIKKPSKMKWAKRDKACTWKTLKVKNYCRTKDLVSLSLRNYVIFLRKNKMLQSVLAQPHFFSLIPFFCPTFLPRFSDLSMLSNVLLLVSMPDYIPFLLQWHPCCWHKPKAWLPLLKFVLL